MSWAALPSSAHNAGGAPPTAAGASLWPPRAPTTQTATRPLVGAAIVVGTVAGVLVLGRMFVESMATR